MRKLTVTFAAAALVFGTMALQANAQNQHHGGMQRNDGALRLWRRLGQRLRRPVLPMPSL